MSLVGSLSFAVVLTASHLLPPVTVAEIRAYRGTHRLVVSLHPQERTPPEWCRQDTLSGMSERKLLLLRAPDAATAQALRRHWQLAPTDKVVLIGLDGGVKGTFDKLPRPPTLFARIDAMPMRQRELARPAHAP